jgi:two-component system CheB/CheR fusion protein
MKGPEQFNAIFDLLYRKTGYRFNYYKHPMIWRRISRRLCLLGITNFDDYVSVLESDDQEARNLASDFMISVTCFFRDRPLWDALKKQVVKPLLKEESTEPIRIWIPGCATGEEVYSSAMLFRFEMEKVGVKRELQIFASDINDKALAKARAGRYAESAISDIPSEYIRKYCLFFEDGRSFEVIKELRKLIVFARHDLLRDPPFSKLDLIICRNLLIYFTPEAQEKCLDIFHYSLKESGVLFLGTAESVGKRSDLFKLFDSKAHLFRRGATGKTHLAIEPPLPEEKARRAPRRAVIKGPIEKKLPGARSRGD